MSNIPDTNGFRNVGPEVTGTASTTAAAINTTVRRSAIYVGNGSGSVPIYVKFTSSTASAPTISASNFHEVVQPGEARVFGVSESIAVWVYSASSAAYTALPVGY